MWNINDYYPTQLANFLRLERIDVQVIRETFVAESNTQLLAAVINNDVRTFEIDRLTGVVSEVTPVEEPAVVSDAERILKLAEALAPSEAEELIAKMRTGNIKGDGLRILHNYAKDRLTTIVSARKIDCAELLKWAEIDNEVEEALAQVYLF